MRKTILSLFATMLVCVNMLAQTSAIKDIRQTYLWDVTLSMKGYNGAPNIYRKVVDAMVKDIESISNDRIEIVVIPFQNTSYCEVWKAYATEAGKKNLIAKIKGYNNENVTNTNISAPLQYAIDNIFTEDKTDIIKLMTDGQDNVNPVQYNAILNRWCEVAKKKDVYGYYILLTPAAKDGDIVMKLQNLCRMEVIDLTQSNDMSISVVSLTPQAHISYNIRDDYGKKIILRYKPNDGADSVPAGYKLHVTSYENEYMKIDQVVELKSDNTVELTPELLMDKNRMIQSLPVDMNELLYLKSEPAEGMDQNPYSMTRILDAPTQVEMINKPEKSVKFHVI